MRSVVWRVRSSVTRVSVCQSKYLPSVSLCLWLQKRRKSCAHCSIHILRNMGHSKQAVTGSSKRYKPLGRIPLSRSLSFSLCSLFSLFSLSLCFSCVFCFPCFLGFLGFLSLSLSLSLSPSLSLSFSLFSFSSLSLFLSLFSVFSVFSLSLSLSFSLALSCSLSRCGLCPSPCHVAGAWHLPWVVVARWWEELSVRSLSLSLPVVSMLPTFVSVPPGCMFGSKHGSISLTVGLAQAPLALGFSPTFPFVLTRESALTAGPSSWMGSSFRRIWSSMPRRRQRISERAELSCGSRL